MDGEATWRVDDFVAERAVYLGEPFEVWDGRRAGDDTPIRWRDGQPWCVPRPFVGPLMRISLYAEGGLRVEVALSTWGGDDAPGRTDLREFFTRLRAAGFDRG